MTTDDSGRGACYAALFSHDRCSQHRIFRSQLDGLAESWKIGCFGRSLGRLAYMRWRFQAKLADRPNLAVAVTAISAAVAYLYMYMLRFPMLVQKVDDERGKPFKSINMTYKAAIVVAYGIGYAATEAPV